MNSKQMTTAVTLGGALLLASCGVSPERDIFTSRVTPDVYIYEDGDLPEAGAQPVLLNVTVNDGGDGSLISFADSGRYGTVTIDPSGLAVTWTPLGPMTKSYIADFFEYQLKNNENPRRDEAMGFCTVRFPNSQFRDAYDDRGTSGFYRDNDLYFQAVQLPLNFDKGVVDELKHTENSMSSDYVNSANRATHTPSGHHMGGDLDWFYIDIPRHDMWFEIETVLPSVKDDTEHNNLQIVMYDFDGRYVYDGPAYGYRYDTDGVSETTGQTHTHNNKDDPTKAHAPYLMRKCVAGRYYILFNPSGNTKGPYGVEFTLYETQPTWIISADEPGPDVVN